MTPPILPHTPHSAPITFPWNPYTFRSPASATSVTSRVWPGSKRTAVPAAMGAAIACPDETVWAVCGDGGFQMTNQEIATIVQEGLNNVKIAVINNGYLGMVRQWQEIFYEERYHATPMFNPDFCKLAEAFGIPTMRVTRREDVEEAVKFAHSVKGPVLVEFMVEKEDMVYPMVPSGADLNDMIRRPKPGEAVTS